MTTFTNIPKHVEELLDVTTSRRDLLKSAGLLLVSFTAARAQSGASRWRSP